MSNSYKYFILEHYLALLETNELQMHDTFMPTAFIRPHGEVPENADSVANFNDLL